tara:strand:- start:1476 stop:2546 length:1071 start_codon:yes stop_codon:yes gene_type:complete
MKVVFVTTINPKTQGDLLELSTLHGMRSVLGANCIDFPRKKIMYHDFSESPKDSLHGRGFTLLTTPIEDLTKEERTIKNIDAIIYGSGHMYGDSRVRELEEKCDNIWLLDGHDLYGTIYDPHRPLHTDFYHKPSQHFFNSQKKNGIKINKQQGVLRKIWIPSESGEYLIGAQFEKSFKRELVEEDLTSVFPTGIGIPIRSIRPINFETKTQLFQKTAPDDSLFKEVKDCGVGGGFTHHTFDQEEQYYQDLSKSWFGLTCKKGGWDCLRHYEIIAAGSLLLFKDYDLKPKQCSPQELPCLTYSSQSELENIFDRLIIKNKPTKEYKNLLFAQRQWLFSHGTTEARAIKILKIINEHL